MTHQDSISPRRFDGGDMALSKNDWYTKEQSYNDLGIDME